MTVVGDEQVFVAVVVIVADARALSPSHLSQAGFLRDIDEVQVADIAIEMAGGILAAALAVHGGRVDQQNIHQAIVVEIENRNPVAGGFEDVTLVVGISRNIFRGQSGLGSDVPKVDCDRWESQSGQSGQGVPSGQSGASRKGRPAGRFAASAAWPK